MAKAMARHILVKTEAEAAALKKDGLQRFELDQVRAWIGDGPDALIEAATKAAPDLSVDTLTYIVE